MTCGLLFDFSRDCHQKDINVFMKVKLRMEFKEYKLVCALILKEASFSKKEILE